MEQTLLLNAGFEPIALVDWRRAVTLWYQGKVEILDVHEREIRGVSVTIRMPAVVRLLRRVRFRSARATVPFTRANIFARDDHECQYCGSIEGLTLDHVVPVAQGGRKSWENIVTCCAPCNRRKDDRTPEQAGMRLRRRPQRPGGQVRVVVGLRTAPSAWRPYLHVEVQE